MYACLSFFYISLLGTFSQKGLQTASKQPQMTSDELSGLNNPCSSAFLAPICFLEPFLRKGRKEGQNGLVDLRAGSSPQIKNAGCNFRGYISLNAPNNYSGIHVVMDC